MGIFLLERTFYGLPGVFRAIWIRCSENEFRSGPQHLLVTCLFWYTICNADNPSEDTPFSVQPMLTKQQIQQICEEIQQNTQVQGILLAGSYVYGTPHEDSDLDVRMVTNDGSNWTDQDTRKFGTRLHAYYNPPEVVRYYFEMKRNVSDPPTIHLWSYGEIVYDPNGIVAQLQQEARQIWKEGCEQGIWIPREKYRDRAVITKKEHEQRW